METRFVDAVRAAFPAGTGTLILGAPVLEGECQPEPLVGLPIAMMNRHVVVNASSKRLATQGKPTGECWTSCRFASRTGQ